MGGMHNMHRVLRRLPVCEGAGYVKNLISVVISHG
ncbi:hypothetical protein Dde_0579 [Oleidesulfovibrio alaskensis G20]|uniref:Uncharacterized protein n=1 Tax=Oleidesulfovibrio alaskensis (strain ATCC BAA-1058 / DSM 17464 / G20) TaxID=207559 RepID=Q315L6_OLEA2|nr:hypothetical protein Dde_0579 [Oleidesulfovibrio alaskensis G20]